MRILILSDRAGRNYMGYDLLEETRKVAQQSKNEIMDAVELNGDTIKPCIGCFGCWIRTPGICAVTDDGMNRLAELQIQSDIIILISEICYGGYSYDIKAFLDRSIPNLSPFFEFRKGDMRHKLRYDRFPVPISIVYGDYSQQESETFLDLAARNNLNLIAPEYFVLKIQQADDVQKQMCSLAQILSREVAV